MIDTQLLRKISMAVQDSWMSNGGDELHPTYEPFLHIDLPEIAALVLKEGDSVSLGGLQTKVLSLNTHVKGHFVLNSHDEILQIVNEGQEIDPIPVGRYTTVAVSSLCVGFPLLEGIRFLIEKSSEDAGAKTIERAARASQLLSAQGLKEFFTVPRILLEVDPETGWASHYRLTRKPL